MVALDPKRTRMDKQRPYIHIAGIAKRIDLFVWSSGNWPGSDLGKWNAIDRLCARYAGFALGDIFFCRNQFIVLPEYYTNVRQWIC